MKYPKITQEQIENYKAEIALRNIKLKKRKFIIYITRKGWEKFDKEFKDTFNYEAKSNINKEH